MLGLTGFVLYHSHRVTARRRGHVSGAFGGLVVKQSDDNIPAEIRSPELNVLVRSAALNLNPEPLTKPKPENSVHQGSSVQCRRGARDGKGTACRSLSTRY
jgi:hypothetical protein